MKKTRSLTESKAGDIDRHVREFHERCRHAEEVVGSLDDVLMLDAESPLRQAVDALIGGYCNALNASYNIGLWLEWWWVECRLGVAPKRAAPAVGALRMIETVDDLVGLILEDCAVSRLKQQPTRKII